MARNIKVTRAELAKKANIQISKHRLVNSNNYKLAKEIDQS